MGRMDGATQRRGKEGLHLMPRSHAEQFHTRTRGAAAKVTSQSVGELTEVPPDKGKIGSNLMGWLIHSCFHHLHYFQFNHDTNLTLVAVVVFQVTG